MAPLFITLSHYLLWRYQSVDIASSTLRDANVLVLFAHNECVAHCVAVELGAVRHGYNRISEIVSGLPADWWTLIMMALTRNILSYDGCTNRPKAEYACHRADESIWHLAQTMCQTLNGKWCVIVFSNSIVFKMVSFNMSPKWRRIDDFFVKWNADESPFKSASSSYFFCIRRKWTNQFLCLH